MTTRPAASAQRGDTLLLSLRALRHLRTGRWQIYPLADALGTTPRTLYRVLHALKRAGLCVEAQREGAEVFYRVRRAELVKVLGL